MSLVSTSTIPGYVIRYRTHAMDGVYSIAAGLALRFVVDAATFHDVKLSGILIGLWEGIVVLHYVNKDPTSSDPYLAYGVRLFVDFLITESVFKLVVVLLWSTMGMVLADVAPAVWVDSGLQRQWSRFRRDLVLSARIFVKRRNTIVRFVPSPTIASTARSEASTVSSVRSRASSFTTTTAIPPSTTAAPESPSVPLPSRPVVPRRRSTVPGTFPGAEWSETETDVGTAVDAPSIPAHVTVARIIPSSEVSASFTEETNSYTTSTRSSSPTYSLEYSDDPSATNPVDIPSEFEDETIAIRAARETTPKHQAVVLPPTPSDSLRDWDSSQTGVEDVPPSPWMPVIPDQELEDWETIEAEDGEEEAPLPPPKDAEAVPVEREEGSDASSMTAPSTIAPNRFPPLEEPPIIMPVPDPAVPPTSSQEEPGEDAAADPVPDTAAPETTNAAGDPSMTDPTPLTQDPPPKEELPPYYSSGFDDESLKEPRVDTVVDKAPNVDADAEAAAPTAEEDVAESPSSATPSVREALALRKEALELNKKISDLRRRRKTSVSGGTSASGAAVMAALEIAKAEQELTELNAKAEGAFVGVYNPPTASLYEFNTTGLTPEEAVRQTEARLGQLLLTPIPPPGTRPEDLAHDTPNRAALKVIMEQSIKGRLVKQGLLAALNSNGLNWREDTARPNVLMVMLPVSAAEPDSATADETEPPERKDDDDDAREY